MARLVGNVRNATWVPVALVVLLLGGIAHARNADSAPSWDPAQGLYVTGAPGVLTFWRMQDGKPAEATAYYLVQEWGEVLVPALYEKHTTPVVIKPATDKTPAVYEDRESTICVEEEHWEWRRAGASAFIYTRTLRAGVPVVHAPPPPGGSRACGAGSCGGGGKACGK